MEESLTLDEQKIVEDFLGTPHWKVLQKMLRIYQRSAEKAGLGSNSLEELSMQKGINRLATQIESDIRRIAKSANEGKR
jgi:predicted sugar kinase